MTVRRATQPRGLFLADILIGLAVVVILTTTLTLAARHQDRASRELAESRAAMRLAGSSITALQMHEPPPTAPDGMKIETQDLADSPGWIKVTVRHGNRSVQLIGMTKPGGAR